MGLVTLTQLRSSVERVVAYCNDWFITLSDAIEELSANSSGSLDFDNKLAWPGCSFITNPKDESTGETVQTIVDTSTQKLKAKKITLDSGDYQFTETYIFYAEDGVTETNKYTVQSVRDASTLIWTETVTKDI